MWVILIEMKVSHVGCFQIVGRWICYSIFFDISFIFFFARLLSKSLRTFRRIFYSFAVLEITMPANDAHRKGMFRPHKCLFFSLTPNIWNPPATLQALTSLKICLECTPPLTFPGSLRPAAYLERDSTTNTCILKPMTWLSME